ncbi:hypothetical protein INS49_000945 [Diaporthe citri]|uniref:uncharacterized protein n=1 Tax=Diaporthe citri TaxID=83186 RepID=UPI001C7F1EC0|nr:uncharacterized protein INS49_000945 [Diaporthe citri]KAG6366765.1 hypothetical protein INS49_000945 [Diaporthe citri]
MERHSHLFTRSWIRIWALIIDLALDNLLGIIECDIFSLIFNTVVLSDTDNKPVDFRLDNDISDAAIGVDVGVGVVGVVLLGVLLMWMYRRGKKAATAGHANKDLKQDEGFVDQWVGSTHMATARARTEPQTRGGGRWQSRRLL